MKIESFDLLECARNKFLSTQNIVCCHSQKHFYDIPAKYRDLQIWIFWPTIGDGLASKCRNVQIHGKGCDTKNQFKIVIHATHVIFFNWFPKKWKKKWTKKIIKFFTVFARRFFVKFDWIVDCSIEIQTYFFIVWSIGQKCAICHCSQKFQIIQITSYLFLI